MTHGRFAEPPPPTASMGPSYAVNNGAAMSNGGNNVAIGLASLGFILCFHALGFTVDLGAYAWQGLCTRLVGVLVRNACGAPRKFAHLLCWVALQL